MPKKSSSPKSTGEKIETSVAPTLVNASEFTNTKKISHQFLAQLVVDLQHNLHRSTAHVKTRGEVAGSTKKPWRQKGTGRARVGSKRTPLWRGGGNIFGPRISRNFHHDINRQTMAPALNTVLSDKALAGEIFSIENPYTGDFKTKSGLQFLQGVLDAQSNLLITAQVEPVLEQAVRNVPYIVVRQANQVNILDVIKVRHIVFLPGALPVLLNRLNA